MKNKLNLIASVMLIICISLTIFTSCKKDDAKSSTTKSAATTAVTEEPATAVVTEQADASEVITEVVTYNDENGYTIYSYIEVSNVASTSSAADVEQAPATAASTTSGSQSGTTSATTPATIPGYATTAREYTTIDPDEFPTMPEISNGIICVRTKYAARGDLVSVSVVMANPGKEYTIEFYENNTRIADTSGLEAKTASDSGTVEWRFIVDDDCEIGTRKLIIREKGTENYAQTYIIVNG